MSNATTAALALVLGTGAGYAIYHFTRDGKKKPDGGPHSDADSGATEAPAATPATSTTSSQTTAMPPRKAGPCSLKLDKDGLTIEGEKVDVPTAVARCKLAGKAELAVAPTAPLAVHRELYGALLAASVPTVVKAP